MAKHYPIGGSTITRTLNCPRWIELSQKLPQPKSSAAADRGTLLHDCMEEIMMSDLDSFFELKGKEHNGIVLDDEMITEALIPAFDLVMELLERYEIEHFICEPFLELQKDYIGGSTDLIAFTADRKTMLVVDYKFGFTPVPPEKGFEQTRFYAMCAAADPKWEKHVANVDTVVHAIIQPACGGAYILEETADKIADLADRLTAALQTPDKMSTGEHCSFCPAAPICPEKKAKAVSALVLDPETSLEVNEALKLAHELEPWIKQIKEQAQDLANEGARFPDFKLVEARVNRKWKPEAEKALFDLLGSQAHELKLIGITAAQKLIGKEKLEELDLLEKPEGKPVLAPADDKRPEIVKVMPDSLKNFVMDNTKNRH